MNSPGPPQSRFDILSWLRTTWTLRTPRVCGGHFAFFVRNPYNMGVYGLPWTPAVKIWQFDLTQDHLDPEDPEGMRRSLCLFCSKPLQYGCLWTRMDPSNDFWGDSHPRGQILGPRTFWPLIQKSALFYGDTFTMDMTWYHVSIAWCHVSITWHDIMLA